MKNNTKGCQQIFFLPKNWAPLKEVTHFGIEGTIHSLGNEVKETAAYLDLQQATGMNYRQKVLAFHLALLLSLLGLQRNSGSPAPAAILKRGKGLEKKD